MPWKGLPSQFTDSIAELDVLLCAEPVNLSRVSNGFRAHPDLEYMIMRLGESLALPLDIPPCTIEEATIGLGTDRLRALVHALSLVKEAPGHIAPSPHRAAESLPEKDAFIAFAGRDEPAPRFAEAGNLETLYLAGFLHWLGAGSGTAVVAGPAASLGRSSIHTLRICSLTDVFMRDFITLIPFLDPALLNPLQKAAPADSGQPRDQEVE
ncbi:MAG: hypothetical protein WB780_02040 [Candidatus Acidiferrales bacterium]